MRSVAIALLLCIVCAVPGAAQSFSERSDLIGQHPDGSLPPQGGALADYNADGLLDLYQPGRLYRQNPDGTFDNVLRGAGIMVEGTSPIGGVFGDANGDGLLDLFIVASDPGSRTYLNQSGSTFHVAPSSLNLSVGPGVINGIWSDVNLDGRLDLFVATTSGQNYLFVAQANGTFGQVSSLQTANVSGPVCSASLRDYDGDRDPELFFSRCRENGAPNAMLLRNHSVARYGPINNFPTGNASSLSSVWFDANNDGMDDLLVLNRREGFAAAPNQFLTIARFPGSSAISIQDRSFDSNLAGTVQENSRQAVAADFDNDGWMDVFIVNTDRPSKLMRNLGDGTFENVASASFPDVPDGTVVLAGDLDNDGWVDLVFPGAEHTSLWYNDGGDNNWLDINLRSQGGNRFGIGAVIEAETAAGTQYRTIASGSGIASQSDELTAHFGLGAADRVDRVRVRWPDGSVDDYDSFEANQRIQLVKGVGVNQAPSAFGPTEPVQGGFYPLGTEEIAFLWTESTDTVSDEVRYRLIVSGNGVNIDVPNITGTEFRLSTEQLIPNQSYTWTVLATDGFDIRGSQASPTFSFGNPETVNSILETPIFYDFGLPSIQRGDVQYVDQDLDGDLDLFISGFTGTQHRSVLYRAENVSYPVPGSEDATFTFKEFFPAPFVLPTLDHARVLWDDLNGDGIPDLVMTGLDPASGTPELSMFENGIIVMTERATNDIPALWNGSLEAGDVDGDGDLDLLISGTPDITEPFQPVTMLLYNNGDRFRMDSAALPGVMGGQARFADIDNDGDLDVALTGNGGGGRPLTAVLRNDDGTFVPLDLTDPELLGGSLAWGDWDLDGDEDLLITGGKLTPNLLEASSIMYRNDGGTTMTPVPTPVRGVIFGQVEWVDFEGDGDLDLFMLGSDAVFGDESGILYRNDAGGLLPELETQGSLYGRFAIGDYNGDGDADIVTTGSNSDGAAVTLFYLNVQVPERLPE